MNLVKDAWIPVMELGGTNRLASLEDIFASGDRFADLAANPCQRIALMRLLICITQAALDGPADEDEWRACRPRLVPAALDYLAKWRDRFNLFGEHAFLQVDGLETATNALADKLDLTLACGNNPTLHDHAASPSGRVPQSAKLALNLLVYQLFSPGGLMGTAKWNDRVTERTSEHAPCLEGSMLHTFLRGARVLETVQLNLLTREQITVLPNTEWGKPSWEIEETALAAIERQSATYLGRLVAMPRAVRSQADKQKITLASGVKYPKLPEYREPAGTVKKIGQGSAERLSYVAVNPRRHPWRELGSILAMQSADRQGGALVLNHLRSMDQPMFDIWTGGLAADKAKLIDVAEWSFTLPRAMLDTRALNRYREGVETAADGSYGLKRSVKSYADFMKSEVVWNDDAQRRYWSWLDERSALLADCAAADGRLSDQWLPLIRSAMRTAYEQTCPHETPRQIEAYVQGLGVLEDWNQTAARKE